MINKKILSLIFFVLLLTSCKKQENNSPIIIKPNITEPIVNETIKNETKQEEENYSEFLLLGKNTTIYFGKINFLIESTDIYETLNYLKKYNKKLDYVLVNSNYADRKSLKLLAMRYNATIIDNGLGDYGLYNKTMLLATEKTINDSIRLIPTYMKGFTVDSSIITIVKGKVILLAKKTPDWLIENNMQMDYIKVPSNTCYQDPDFFIITDPIEIISDSELCKNMTKIMDIIGIKHSVTPKIIPFEK